MPDARSDSNVSRSPAANGAPRASRSGAEANQESAVMPALGYEDLGGQPLADENGRQRYDTFELAMVLSHYPVGIIQKCTPFPRGSRKAPKLVIRSDLGYFLLKRRARGKDDPFKVAFCHGIQLHLAAKGFPLPHLIGTRQDNNSILRLESGTYELFEYIRGTGFDGSPEATAEAGRTLGLFHKLLLDHEPQYESPSGSYHRSGSVVKSLEMVPTTIQRVRSQDVPRAQEVVQSLMRNYKRAAKAAEDLGLSEWPKQIVHSDWHPGNSLFRGSQIVAVIDYDAARVQQRVLDVANGALQFSIIGSGDTPIEEWPVAPDLERFGKFIQAYDSIPDHMLSQAELHVLPQLMIQALIAEAAIPIAAAGRFAQIEGVAFLQMVQRKIRWLRDHGEELIEAATR